MLQRGREHSRPRGRIWSWGGRCGEWSGQVFGGIEELVTMRCGCRDGAPRRGIRLEGRYGGAGVLDGIVDGTGSGISKKGKLMLDLLGHDLLFGLGGFQIRRALDNGMRSR